MVIDFHPLDHYEFVRVSGADAVSFLQGQLSCNTKLLSEHRSLTGALCNLKGRVIADFRILKHEDDCILQCAQGMATAIVSTLSKYAVFSKVNISVLNSGTDDVNISAIGVLDDSVETALRILGINLPADDDNLVQNSDYSFIKLPGPARRAEIWFHSKQAKQNFISNHGLQESAELDRWRREDIASGIIHVTPALTEEFTPQLLNYDISGLIDFNKGCYTGQEIVARMFYRGTAKKRLYLAVSSHNISADSRVLEKSKEKEDNQGNEILAYNNFLDRPSLLLTILSREVAASASPLRLSDQPDSTVTMQKLPYFEAG